MVRLRGCPAQNRVADTVMSRLLEKVPFLIQHAVMKLTFYAQPTGDTSLIPVADPNPRTSVPTGVHIACTGLLLVLELGPSIPAGGNTMTPMHS